VVDMESYWICQIAGERDVPFIAVRTIFDTVQDDLSLLGHMMVEGKVTPLKALGYLISHPGRVRKIVAYYINSKKARRNLAFFLHNLAKDI
jgi:hypothetical protein